MTTGAWHGEAYRRAAIMQRTWGMRLIERLAPRAGERVLDLGSGEGTLTAEIARRVGTTGAVLGVDASASMVEAAADHREANLSFRVVRAEEMAFDGEFDAVFSNAVLHWIHDHETVTAKVHRALKPGGRFVAEFGGFGNCREFFQLADHIAITEFARWHPIPPKANANRYSTAADFSRCLRLAGFRRRRTELHGRPARFGTREAAEAWFRTTGHPYLAPLPEDLHEAFVRVLFDRYGARENIHAGRWTLRFMRLVVEAWKAPA